MERRWRQQKLIRWISFGFCVFNHTPISFIKSSHQHFIFRIFSSFLPLALQLLFLLLLCLLLLLLFRRLLLCFVFVSFRFSLFRTILFIVFLFVQVCVSVCVIVCVLFVFLCSHSLSRAIYAACHAPPPLSHLFSLSLSVSVAALKLFTKWNCFRINNFIKIKLLLLLRLCLSWLSFWFSLLLLLMLLFLLFIRSLFVRFICLSMRHLICLPNGFHSLPPRHLICLLFPFQRKAFSQNSGVCFL